LLKKQNIINPIKINKMKIKSMFMAFTLKALLFITCSMVGFAGFTKCNAQSIVGKWNEVSTKGICNAKGVKITGKEFIITQDPKEGGSFIELRSDHTYTKSEITAAAPKAVILNGTWTLSGDQLTATLDSNQPNPINNPKKDAVSVSTITINGNSLVISHLMPAGSPIIEKMETTYKRI
jgi:Lipocalin-like domain